MPKMYLYNGLKLPKLPDYDAVAYPYAAIFYIPSSYEPNGPLLLVCNPEPILSDSGGSFLIKAEISCLAYLSPEGGEKWTSASLIDQDEDSGYNRVGVALLWNNAGIRNLSDPSQITHSGSEPVALPDAPTVLSFGWTTDTQNVLGMTLTITASDPFEAKLLVSAEVDEGELRVQWYRNGVAGKVEQSNQADITSLLEDIAIPESGSATWQCLITNSLNGYTETTKTRVATLAITAKPLNSRAIMLLGWLTGQRFAGHRKGKEPAAPVAYLYNGVRLPQMPEWDKNAFPYAVTFIDYLGRYEFVVTASPMYVHGEYSYLPPNYSWYLSSDGEWAIQEYQGNGGDTSLLPFWANTDILYENGTTYLEASEPVPVYD